MSRTLVKRLAGIAAVLTILGAGAAGFYWGYYLPSERGRTRAASLTNAASDLMANSNLLVDTANLPMFQDLNESPQVCSDNVTHISQLVQHHNALTDKLEAVAADGGTELLYGLSREAARNRAHTTRAQAVAKQTRQVVTKYMTMAAFLNAYCQTENEYLTLIATLANTDDLNDYVNRSDELRAGADSLNGLAERLKKTTPPDELAGLRDQAAALYQEMGAGYSDLADGIDAAVDDMIYGAARRIEAAIGKHDAEIPVEYTRVMSTSQTIKQLEELPEKYIIEQTV